MEQFIDPIVEALVGIAILILCFLLGVCINAVRNWLKIRKDTHTNTQLDVIIGDLVDAADQVYRNIDSTGTIRNAYVKDNLIQLGYQITDYVNAKIEAKVYNAHNNPNNVTSIKVETVTPVNDTATGDEDCNAPIIEEEVSDESMGDV